MPNVGEIGGQRDSRKLLAVLCNPPLRPAVETTSWSNLEVLRDVLGLARLEIVNLVEHQTRSTSELTEAVGAERPERVERRVAGAAAGVGTVVVGWGTGVPAGARRAAWRTLIAAAQRGLLAAGHDRVLHVSGLPRHPSRWRQHTSDIHDRYPGSTFEERLFVALMTSLVAEL